MHSLYVNCKGRRQQLKIKVEIKNKRVKKIERNIAMQGRRRSTNKIMQQRSNPQKIKIHEPAERIDNKLDKSKNIK